MYVITLFLFLCLLLFECSGHIKKIDIKPIAPAALATKLDLVCSSATSYHMHYISIWKPFHYKSIFIANITKYRRQTVCCITPW